MISRSMSGVIEQGPQLLRLKYTLVIDVNGLSLQAVGDKENMGKFEAIAVCGWVHVYRHTHPSTIHDHT